jgi:hypothetical protein
MVHFQYRFFGKKTPGEHQAKVQVFFDEQPHVTMPIFSNIGLNGKFLRFSNEKSIIFKYIYNI